MRPGTATPRTRGDRGVTAVLFAVSISGMLSVGALVMAGSLGYSAVRTAQNGADAAAVAGAATLRDVRSGDAAPGDVGAVVSSVAQDNQADPATTVCEVVNANYALTHSPADVIGPCGGTNELALDASGVRVSTNVTRDAPFGVFVGAETVTGDAVATAAVQPIRSGSAPFMVCASPSAIGHPAPALVPDPIDPTGFVLNQAALGLSYVLHGNAMKNGGRQCGGGSASWRGFMAFKAGPFPIPSPDPIDDTDWWEVKTGNANGHLDARLAGDDACRGPIEGVVGCRLALPLCTHSNGESGLNLKLHCVKYGVFEITYNQLSTGPAPCLFLPEDTNLNGLVCGSYIGTGVAMNGLGGANVAGEDDLVVIKLVE